MTVTRASLAIVSDNPSSWAIAYNQDLAGQLKVEGHRVALVHKIAEAPAADIAVYLNCERIIPAHERARFRNNVVVHASALPEGRGWSPLTWSILAGAERVMLTLFEAADEVDAGPIYLQHELRFEGHELIDELRRHVALGSQALVREFAAGWPHVPSRPQVGVPTFFPRRRPVDSRLDPDRPLREQFNLLRVVDDERYPAYFEHAGHVYELRISKRGAGE